MEKLVLTRDVVPLLALGSGRSKIEKLVLTRDGTDDEGADEGAESSPISSSRSASRVGSGTWEWWL